MDIRLARKEDILPILRLAWKIYSEEIMPFAPENQTAEIHHSLKYENFIPYIANKEKFVFGAYDNGTLKGALVLKRDGLVHMVFVAQDYRKRGVAKALLDVAERFCASDLQLSVIKVRANLIQEGFYHKLGFNPTHTLQEEGEEGTVLLIKQIWQMSQSQGMQRAIISTNSPKTGAVIAIVIGIIISFTFVFVIFGGLVYQWISQYNERTKQESQIILPEEPGDDEEWFDDEEDEATGIYALEVYEDKQLDFAIEEEEYSQNKQSNMTYIDFHIVYPSLKDMADEKLQNTINEEIKKVAMVTADELYLNPSESTREQIMKSDDVNLVSYVAYKVTYVTNDFISVVFDDSVCRITQNNVNRNLRTININLKTGAIYSLADIVKLDDEFLNDFRMNMQLEAEDQEFLSELSDEALRTALLGRDQTGEYVPEFFFDKEGIQIGFDISVVPESEVKHVYSWITAAFTDEEIKPHKNNNDFWFHLGEFDN